MRYLDTDDIIDINAEVLGGGARLRDRSVLESAVARSQASAFGEDAYPTLAEKAAALLHSLILNHPFLDGNKRTATLALIEFLDENGFRLTWEQSEALEFIIAIAEGKYNVPEIAHWLEENIAPIV